MKHKRKICWDAPERLHGAFFRISFYNDTEAMGTQWMHYVLTSSYYTNGKLYNVYLVFGCDGTSNATLTQELIKIVEVGSGGVSFTEA